METVAPAITSLLARPSAERRIGPFMLIDELGAGGYAPVWLARETYGKAELRTAAVKLFSIDASSPERSRILEEARALCRVEHPNVVRFYTLAIDEEACVMGLAMEHVAGRTLEDKLEGEGKLSVDEALRVGVAIASALAAVHGAGIVHRDVKPSNIVEEAGGAYKLIDFGIASATLGGGDDVVPAEGGLAETGRIGEPTDAMLSSLEHQLSGEAKTLALAPTARGTGLISGTLGYIDPACFGGGAPPSSASDLYALGATIYRCISGALPAEKASGDALDTRVLLGHAQPISLGVRTPDAPRALVALIDHLLAPDAQARPPRASWVAHHLEQIRRDLEGLGRALPPEDVGPFRGLSRFEADDRDVFFGRTREIAAAIELLRGRGLVALVGPSGSGKSSLARAGLLPALAGGALSRWPEVWDTAIVEPGRDPRAAIGAALAPFVPDALTLDPEALALALAKRASEEDRGLVLLVDQLEELVTTSSPESREEAAALLVRLGAQPIPGVRAVVAARRDLLDPLLAMELGKTMARGLCLVEPLGSLDWRNIVERALASYRYELEDETLADDLFAEIGATADAMPLVEFALTELWNERDRPRKRLTRAALAKVGGIEGALERHAEATIAAMEDAHEGSIDVARRVLLALTTAEGTRRVMSALELVEIAGAEARRVIGALEGARLVVPAEGGVTLAHEALASRWQRLASWIAEARDERLLVEEIERDAARWKRDPESVALWKGRRLDFANEIARKNAVRMSAAARELVRASRRAARRGKVLAAAAAMAFLLAAFGAGVLYLRAEEKIAQDKLTYEKKARKEAEDNDREKTTLLQQLVDEKLLTADKDALIKQLIDKSKPAPVNDAAPPVAPPSATAAATAAPRPSTNGTSAAPQTAASARPTATTSASTRPAPPPSGSAPGRGFVNISSDPDW